MIDDLVKRLRNLAFHYYLGRSFIEEAADRIEQLTGEVQRWQGMFDEKHNLMLEHKARAEAAEAERDRLREALDDMWSGWRYIRQNHGDLPGVGWERCEAKARAALKGENHE